MKCERCSSTENLARVHLMDSIVDFYLCMSCANDVPASCIWVRKYLEKIGVKYVGDSTKDSQ